MSDVQPTGMQSIGISERHGSSKVVTFDPRTPDVLSMGFTDKVSVFDRGSIPTIFQGLGELRCAIATKVFDWFAEVGITTHFIRSLDAKTIAVKALNIPELDISYPGAIGRLLPLELLFRYAITPKFFNRINKGEVNLH